MSSVHELARRVVQCFRGALLQLQHRVRLVANSFRDAVADMVGTSLADTLGQIIREIATAVSEPWERSHFHHRDATDYWDEPYADWGGSDEPLAGPSAAQAASRCAPWRQALVATSGLVVRLWRHARNWNLRWTPVFAGAVLGLLATANLSLATIINPFSRLAERLRRGNRAGT